MTLILTHFSRFGIIHASDSNLTHAEGYGADQVQKTFQLPHLMAGMTYSGSYGVGNVPFNKWLAAFVHDHTSSRELTLQSFASALADRLSAEMDESQRGNPNIVHIGGYVEHDGAYHPEFWFVRNVHGIDEQTGEYANVQPIFAFGEEFWSRECATDEERAELERGKEWSYFNGFPEGRIAFNGLSQLLNQFFGAVWQTPEWSFRPPRNLDERILFVKTSLSIIIDLFRVSNIPGPVIGGDIQTYGIPRPHNRMRSI